MKEDLKEIILIGLGAVSLTSEKAKEMKDEMLKKGKEVFEQGKIANEELKHNIAEKIKENVTVVEEKTATKEDLKDIIKKMTAEEKKELLGLLKEKEKATNEK